MIDAAAPPSASRPPAAGVPWTAACVAIALALAAPLLVVGSSLARPGGEAWDHLVSTVLAGYVANSAGSLNTTSSCVTTRSTMSSR